MVNFGPLKTFPKINPPISVKIQISEGSPYYFGNITWVGNSKYSNNELDNLLGIEKGDIYDNTVLQTRLLGSPDSRDVHSKYLDNGYLFSQVTPIEIEVRNDTIDLEIRIYEGQQARINKVTVMGNTKTNDHVIMREIRTKPGDLFNRSLIMRLQRELATLNYFDAEKLDIDVSPDPQNGTVDLTYVVEEKSTDQIELQGGYGADRIIGTFRLSFNNFSARKMFSKGKGNWTPLPSGDGQRLSLAASSNGLFYQSANISFTEPWLGGKKPNALTIGSWHSVQRSRTSIDMPIDSMPKMKITGVTVGLGKRLNWPDDFFTLYQNITLKKFPEPKPVDFTGAVGSFNIKAEVDTSIIKQNDAITYKITMSGSGNIGLFPIPKLEFPKTIEAFPPEEMVEKDGFRDKITGEKIWKYILIPRQPGKVSLPYISMSYFDPDEQSWVRITTENIILNVEADDENLSNNFGMQKKEIELLNKDIRFISNDVPNFTKIGVSGTNATVIIYFTSLFIVVLPRLLAKYLGYRLDTRDGRRRRNAYKKSLKMLHKNNSSDHFEIANNALQIYLIDKFNLTENVLDKTSIKLLVEKKISSDLQLKLFEVIENFNEARFSQSSNVTDLDPIMEMEDLLKRMEKQLK